MYVTNSKRKMAFNIPHKEQTGSKWLTATLVSVYIIIAVLAILYGVEKSTAKEAMEHHPLSKQAYSAQGTP